MLLRGITLTDAQKQRVAALHDQQRQQMDGQRDAGRKAFDDVRAARQRGDTAAASLSSRWWRNNSSRLPFGGVDGFIIE